MSRSNAIWLEQAAAQWNEALPVGNGRLGAMVFGGVQRERLQLNEDTLWSGEPVKASDPDLWRHLDEVRRLVFAGQYQEATEACQHLQGPFTQSFLPMGDLWLEFGHGANAEDYRRELNLDTATVEISYRIGEVTFRRSIFVSAPDQALVIRLTASQPDRLNFSAALTTPLRGVTTAQSPHSLHLSGRAPAHVEPNYRDVEPAVVYDEAPDGKGMRFAATMRAVVEGRVVQSGADTLNIVRADCVTLYLTAATSFNGFDRSPSREGKDPSALVEKAMNEVAAKPFDQIYSDHLSEYRRFFGRVTLELGEAGAKSDIPTDKRLKALAMGEADNGLAALYFHYGRYLLISSSRPGTQPANLQGIWNQDVRPAWSSNYTININTQMNYWPAQTTNLAELSLPLFDLIDALRVNGRDVAHSYYRARGWCAHHNTDQWALANPVGNGQGNPAWANWPMGGAWLVAHGWEHFAFGGDREFLRERVYPALKGVAEFLLDFLVESPDGELVTCPSTSPENEFDYTTADGRRAVASVTTGATMDLVIIRETFQNTIEATRILGVDEDFADTIADALRRLPPFQIGEHGELREWPANRTEADLGHRHISHLYANHPGALITSSKTPELAIAVRKSLDRRVEHGGGYTGWSRAWLICQYARLGDGDKAHDSLHVLLAESTYPNLLDVHPPFQIDGNFGGAAGIAEMLLQSHDDAVELLPALPRAWPSGQVSGLRARGGFEVAIEWQKGALTAATISSRLAAVCQVRYGAKCLTLDCRAGEVISVNANLEAGGSASAKPKT